MFCVEQDIKLYSVSVSKVLKKVNTEKSNKQDPNVVNRCCAPAPNRKIKFPKKQQKNCSDLRCNAYYCAQLSYTTQHGTVLAMFPLNLQTSIIAQILSTGREGNLSAISGVLSVMGGAVKWPSNTCNKVEFLSSARYRSLGLKHILLCR